MKPARKHDALLVRTQYRCVDFQSTYRSRSIQNYRSKFKALDSHAPRSDTHKEPHHKILCLNGQYALSIALKAISLILASVLVE